MLGSLLLHAALTGLVIFLLRWAPETSPIQSSRRASPVIVTLAPKRMGNEARLAPSKSKSEKSSPSRRVIKLGSNFDFKAGGNAPDGARIGADASPDGYETSNSMTIEQEAEIYPFFSALWRKIDASTGYPDDFVKDRVTGYATVQLTVSEQGVFTGRLVGVNSDQPLLEAYVLGVLFHALSEPLPQKLWHGHGPAILVARFDFKTITYGQVAPPREQAGLKNVLEFARFGYVDPKLKQEIERLYVRYVPPVLPVPGGAFIDFIRVYQMVRNWRSEHVGQQGLHDMRMELKREQWRSMIRKPGESAPAASL